VAIRAIKNRAEVCGLYINAQSATQEFQVVAGVEIGPEQYIIQYGNTGRSAYCNIAFYKVKAGGYACFCNKGINGCFCIAGYCSIRLAGCL